MEAGKGRGSFHNIQVPLLTFLYFPSLALILCPTPSPPNAPLILAPAVDVSPGGWLNLGKLWHHSK